MAVDERQSYLDILNISDDPNLSLNDLKILVFNREFSREVEMGVPVPDPAVAFWADDAARPTELAEDLVVMGYNDDTGNLDIGVGDSGGAPVWFNATLTAE